VEEQFYIFFPLFLWGVWKKNLRLLTFLVVLTWVSYRWNLAAYKKDPAFDFYSPVTRFWELLAGVLLALWERRQGEGAIAPMFRRWRPQGEKLAGLAWRVFFRDARAAREQSDAWRSFVSVLGVLLLAFALVKAQTVKFPGKQALVPVLGAFCLIAAGPRAWANRVLFSLKPAVWIGLISYPLYLWHWPLLSYARIIFGEMPARGWRIGMLLLAIVLAAITWWLIERPIRFGKRAKAFKIGALVTSMLVAGCVGGWVFKGKGIAERKAVEKARVLMEDLEKPLATEESCRLRYGAQFEYCRHKDIGARHAIALLGDSHGQFAFPAIADYVADKGYNTLFLGGRAGSSNPVIGLSAEPSATEKLFEILEADKNIRKVFLITRGVAYYGFDHDQDYAERYAKENKNKDIFYDSAFALGFAIQRTIDRLNRIGKTVYVLAENPVWPGMVQGNNPQYIRALVNVQPLQEYFKPVRKEIRLYKKDVLEHQKDYLDMLKTLKGATVIQSIDAFCPTEECLLFNDKGFPLYWDDDHISQRTGGKFLVEKVLKPYLDE
jgi:hypothetical protein